MSEYMAPKTPTAEEQRRMSSKLNKAWIIYTVIIVVLFILYMLWIKY